MLCYLQINITLLVTQEEQILLVHLMLFVLLVKFSMPLALHTLFLTKLDIYWVDYITLAIICKGIKKVPNWSIINNIDTISDRHILYYSTPFIRVNDIELVMAPTTTRLQFIIIVVGLQIENLIPIGALI